MYDRFTDEAREAVARANKIANLFGYEYIASEHILLGVLNSTSRLSVGLNFLKLCGLSIGKLIDSTNARIEILRSATEPPSQAKLPSTPRAKEVFEHAMEEARAMGNSFVGTEHLILGILRAEGCVAADVLRDNGLTLEKARQKLEEMKSAPQSEVSRPIRQRPQLKCKVFTSHYDTALAFSNLMTEFFAGRIVRIVKIKQSVVCNGDDVLIVVTVFYEEEETEAPSAP